MPDGLVRRRRDLLGATQGLSARRHGRPSSPADAGADARGESRPEDGAGRRRPGTKKPPDHRRSQSHPPGGLKSRLSLDSKPHTRELSGKGLTAEYAEDAEEDNKKTESIDD